MAKQQVGNKFYFYSIALDIPVNKPNPELYWNIRIDKIKEELDKVYIEEYSPTLMFYDLSYETINEVFLNLVYQSKPNWFIREQQLYTKITLPVILMYNDATKKKIAFAAFEVLNSQIQDKPVIVWM